MKIIDENYNWDLFHNFTAAEIRCKCGCNELFISKQLMLMLDGARERAGVPFIITSGYRCVDHNESVGGSSESQHILARAADIACDDKNRLIILKSLLEVGFKSIIIYDTFIHVDVREDSIGCRIGF